MKRILFVATLLCLISQSSVVHAQKMPLSEADSLIQQKSEKNEAKATQLKSTSEDIQELLEKKTQLSQQLDQAKIDIDTLAQKIADKKAAQEAERKRLEEIKNMFVHINLYAPNSSGNMYALGNCTWYAKSRRPDIPNNLGNANTWYVNAASQGWSVGAKPKKGAVGVTTRGSLGHVVYVEGVSLDSNSITISEMNYSGLYSTRTRQANASEFQYIYELN